MGKYRYILFDADDTLFDFAKAEQNALRATFSELSIPFNDTTYKSYLMINHDLWKGFELGKVEKKTIQTERFVKLFQTISCNLSGADASRVYQRHLSRQTVLLPFAKELCQSLYGRVNVSIVTNGVAETQRIDL